MLTFACATPPIEPTGTDKATIAIRVKRPRPLFGPEIPSSVYFVRLEEDGQYRQERVFVSNYQSDGFAYLVNAAPGKYAAIGANVIRHTNTASSNTTNPNSRSTTEYWYFSEGMIDDTIVTVDPLHVVFMGEFEISGSVPLEDADETQKHYLNFFTGYERSGAVVKFFHRLGGSGFPAEYQEHQCESVNQRFLDASQPLAEAGWNVIGCTLASK
jgi:hypothetical protein